MVFDFELEGKNLMKHCDKCDIGLVKHYKTLVQGRELLVVGVCDNCGSVIQSSETLHSLGSVAFIGA